MFSFFIKRTPQKMNENKNLNEFPPWNGQQHIKWNWGFIETIQTQKCWRTDGGKDDKEHSIRTSVVRQLYRFTRNTYILFLNRRWLTHIIETNWNIWGAVVQEQSAGSRGCGIECHGGEILSWSWHLSTRREFLYETQEAVIKRNEFVVKSVKQNESD